MGQTGAEKCGRGPTKYKSRCCNQHVSIRSKPFVLPKGLVGAKCTAEVFIVGRKCSCLFDTGLIQIQVTTNTLDLAYESQFDSEAAQPPQNSPYGFKAVINVFLCGQW